MATYDIIGLNKNIAGEVKLLQGIPAADTGLIKGQLHVEGAIKTDKPAETKQNLGIGPLADVPAPEAQEIIDLRPDLSGTGNDKGAELVEGIDIEISNYTALRAYTGGKRNIRIVDAPTSGPFYYDPLDVTSSDNGGTIIVASDGKRWKRKYTGAAQASWFGAKGDGISDARAPLNALLAIGGPIQFEKNAVYRITGSLSASLWVDLDGNNAELIHDSASGTPILDCEQISGRITNLRMDGKKALKPNSQSQGYGVYLHGCEGFEVSGCKIKDTHEHGIGAYSINPEDPPGLVPCRKLTLVNNIFDGIGNLPQFRGSAIWCFGYVDNLVITGNIGHDCIEGITVDDASGSGPIREARTCVIANNIMYAKGDAVRYESASEATITGNIAVVDVEPGMGFGGAVTAIMVRSIQASVDPVKKVVVSGNVAISPQYAIFAGSVETCTIIGNVAIQTNPNAVSFSNTAAIRVSTTNPRYTQDVSVMGNEVRSETSGIIVEGLSGNLLRSVTVKGNTCRYIGSGAPVVDGHFGIFTTLCEFSEVTENTIFGFDQNIRVTAPTEAATNLYIVSRNTSMAASRYGIAINSTASYVMRDNITRTSGIAGYNIFTASIGPHGDISGNSHEPSTIPASYRNGLFNTSYGNTNAKGAATATAAQLGSATNAINTSNKGFGKIVIDTTNNRMMYSGGAAATDLWYVVDGSASITPA